MIALTIEVRNAPTQRIEISEKNKPQEIDVKQDVIIVHDGGGTCEGAVLSVNGITPDENGNVEIDTATSWNDLEDKPFGEELVTGEIVSNLTAEDYNSGNFPPCNFVVGSEYDVIWNGEHYSGLICYFDEPYNVISGEGCPFYIDDNGGDSLYVESTNGEEDFTLTIIGENRIIPKIDEKYIPDTIARIDYVYELIDDAVGESGGVTSWNDLEDKPDFAPIATSGSWNDLEDKPFGVGTTEWKQVVTTSDSIPSNQNGVEIDYTIPIPTTFLPVVGKKYKIEVIEAMLQTVTKSVTAYCTEGTTPGMQALNIGTTKDPVYYSNTFGIVANVFFTAVGYMGWHVKIYEEAEIITTLDEKYIPNTIARVEDIPTEADIQALIDEALGVIENGSY